MGPGISDVLAGILNRWRWDYRLQLVRNQQQKNEDTHFKYGTVFSFKSLKKATKNFSHLIRRGGFTSCYKGTLQTGTVVTVKVLKESCSSKINFFSVVRTMSRISHRNMVEFVGYCLEGNHRIIVYEFVGEYDLNSLLFSNEGESQSELSWLRRTSICLGVARGIQYLHQGISPGVIHHDIKTWNVLVDENFNPKITDFELAHPIDDALSDYDNQISGTFGYIAPEHVVIGELSEKNDVYSFGVLLLEVITGRRRLESVRENSDLVAWVWGLRERGRVMEIVDPRLSEVPEEEEMVRFINTALICVHPSSNQRPSMFEVLLMLSGGYDFSQKVLTNPTTIPAIVYDLMDRPVRVNRR